MNRTNITKFFKVFFSLYAIVVMVITFSKFEIEKNVVLMSEWDSLLRLIFLTTVVCITFAWIVHDIDLSTPKKEKKSNPNKLTLS